jgi:Fur family ferric uptake transcriptional regulator
MDIVDKSMTPETYLKRLREHGHRVTPKVRAVLELFLERGSVLGPFEVRDRLQKRFKGVGLPTVYRILEGLANCGILLTAPNEDRQLRYFICRKATVQNHLLQIEGLCAKCARIPARAR